jgi:hypothetical protein
VDTLNKVYGGFRYYAAQLANNALKTYKLNFDGLLASFQRFTEGAENTLTCDAPEDVEVDDSLFRNIFFEF